MFSNYPNEKIPEAYLDSGPKVVTNANQHPKCPLGINSSI